jgi:hypothetical protein
VPEKKLNGTNIGASLKQVRGEGVPQRVRGDWLGNVRCAVRFLASLANSIRVIGWSEDRRETATASDARLSSTAARSQAVAARALRSGPSALCLDQPGASSLAVDVRDLEVGGFGNAQASRIDCRQKRSMLETTYRFEEVHHFLSAEDYRQLEGPLGHRNFFNGPRLFERHLIQEAQRAGCQADAARRKLPGFEKIQLVGPNVLRPEFLWWGRRKYFA